jgi:hypothetical protein
MEAQPAEVPRTVSRIDIAAFAASLVVVLAGTSIPRFVMLERWTSPWLIFATSGAVGLTIVGTAVGWERHALGLVLRPRQSAWYWLKAAAVVGMAIALVCAAAIAAARAGHDGFGLCERSFPPAELRRVIELTIFAPMTEELLWRIVLCTAAARVVGPWPAIALDGVLFAGAHWLHGVSGPDNLVAGFFFAWAFLKSGTFVVPVALHATGNALVLVLQSGSVIKQIACGP